MPKDIHTQDSSQQRASKLLLAMGVIVLLGALAYFGLTLAEWHLGGLRKCRLARLPDDRGCCAGPRAAAGFR